MKMVTWGSAGPPKKKQPWDMPKKKQPKRPQSKIVDASCPFKKKANGSWCMSKFQGPMVRVSDIPKFLKHAQHGHAKAREAARAAIDGKRERQPRSREAVRAALNAKKSPPRQIVNATLLKKAPPRQIVNATLLKKAPPRQIVNATLLKAAPTKKAPVKPIKWLHPKQKKASGPYVPDPNYKHPTIRNVSDPSHATKFPLNPPYKPPSVGSPRKSPPKAGPRQTAQQLERAKQIRSALPPPAPSAPKPKKRAAAIPVAANVAPVMDPRLADSGAAANTTAFADKLLRRAKVSAERWHKMQHIPIAQARGAIIMAYNAAVQKMKDGKGTGPGPKLKARRAKMVKEKDTWKNGGKLTKKMKKRAKVVRQLNKEKDKRDTEASNRRRAAHPDVWGNR
jgi:hypothetical protein